MSTDFLSMRTKENGISISHVKLFDYGTNI